MQRPAADTVAIHPTWLLKTRSATSRMRARLWSRRLISYEEIANAFEHFDYLDHLTSLHEHLFSERPQVENVYSIYDIESAIIQKIDEDRFPLDLTSIQMSRNGGDGQLMFYIMPIQGWAVGWHMLHFNELYDADKPMVAACAPVIYGDGDGGNADHIIDWWQGHGIDEPPTLRQRLAWPLDEGSAPVLLRRLPAPLDGLAGLYQATIPVGNPFFDYAGHDWDYLYWEDILWEQDTIDLLTTLWETVEDDIERLDAYYRWFGATDDTEAVTRIVEAFRQVETWYQAEVVHHA